jgi:orotate phosphoribosyltransferase-like protein
VKDNSVKDQFIELRAQGMSFASIAKSLDVSKTTLVGWSKDLNVEISNMRQMHLEAMREKHRMGIERRMVLFSKQLDSVETELGKRTLENIPTERLVNMAVKLGHELNAFMTPIIFQERSDSFEIDLSTLSEWEV